MEFIKKTRLSEIVDFCGPLIGSHSGDLNQQVEVICSTKNMRPSGFSFINHPKLLDTVLKSELKAVLIPESLSEKAISLNTNKVLLFSKNVDLASTKIKNEFVFKTPYRGSWEGIHPSAVVDESAEISIGVTIAPFAVIGKNCKIGEGSFIGAHAIIEDNAILKSHVTLHAGAYIGHSCVVGHHCEIQPYAVVGSEGFGYSHDHLGNHYRTPHTGRVVLEDDVHIGAQTAIDRGTLDDSRIGQGTKIDNQCHLAHNSVVGKNGLLTAQLVAAGSTTIGDNFRCGGKTAVTGHINITDNVHVAGFSAIANDVKKPGQYGGYPLQPLREALKTKATSVHLPEIRKQLNRVLRKLFPEDYKE